MPRHYDDDDDHDRPRRRRRYDDDDGPRRRGTEGGNGMVIVLVLGGLGLLLLFGGIGVGAFLLLRADNKPEPDVAEAPAPANANPENRPALPGMLPGNPPPPKQPQPGKNPPVAPPPKKSGPALVQGVVSIPTINPYVQQIIFGGSPNDGFAAIIAMRTRGVGQQIDVVQTATGKLHGQIVTNTASDNGYALSADGKWLAVLGSTPFAGHPVKLYSIADGKLVGQFTPYPRNEGNNNLAPELVWVAFVAPDRLLTINEASGYDVWSVPDFKRIAGQPSRKVPALSRVDSNGFTKSPINFAVSPDGSILALFNGEGFTFYNPRTAAEITRSAAIVVPPDAVNFAGAALSPDGDRFACFYSVFGRNGGTYLRVWNVKTGREVAGGPVKSILTPAGFAWWGPDHLVFWKGGVSSGDLFSLDSGTVVGRIRTSVPGKLATVPPNGQLWWVTGGALFDPDTGAAFLVRADIPRSIPAKVEYELTTTGLKSK